MHCMYCFSASDLGILVQDWMGGRLVAYAQLIGCSRYLCILLLDCNDGWDQWGYLYVHIAHLGSIPFLQSLHCLHIAPGASPIGVQGFQQWHRLGGPCHIGRRDVNANIYAYCICITFLVALVVCSVRYQLHQLPGITLGLPGMYHMHVYLVHPLIASFVHYREVYSSGYLGTVGRLGTRSQSWENASGIGHPRAIQPHSFSIPFIPFYSIL